MSTCGSCGSTNKKYGAHIHFHDGINVEGPINKTDIKNIHTFPKRETWSDSFINNVRKIDLGEKLCGVFAHSFEFLAPQIQKITPALFFQTLDNTHTSAHQLEKFLHVFCPLGSFIKILSGRFIEYKEEGRKGSGIDWLKMSGKVCLVSAQTLCSASCLSSMGLYQSKRVELLSEANLPLKVLGHGLSMIYLVKNRFFNSHPHVDSEIKKHFYTDLTIYLSGFVSSVVQLVEDMPIAASIKPHLQTIESAASVINELACIKRLMPEDDFKIHPLDIHFMKHHY